jgi:hypothetical protein
VLTTDQKGNIAEAAVALAAVKLGFDVYLPITEGGRYDLIIQAGPRLLRVQCKWAGLNGDVIVLRSYSARRSVGGKLINRHYTRDEVDMFAAYSPDLDQCFLLPPELWERRRQVHLRISPTLNNQARGINWAKDFELAATLGALGAVAQLGERQSGTLEATGSSPVGSTLTSPARQVPRATTGSCRGDPVDEADPDAGANHSFDREPGARH